MTYIRIIGGLTWQIETTWKQTRNVKKDMSIPGKKTFSAILPTKIWDVTWVLMLPDDDDRQLVKAEFRITRANT